MVEKYLKNKNNENENDNENIMDGENMDINKFLNYPEYDSIEKYIKFAEKNLPEYDDCNLFGIHESADFSLKL